jgi:predicted polyphosphate/ATP-dependent NAD kinase
MDKAVVGIIANPASGKDIRRLVAHGSVFDNIEKVNIVRRALLGLEAVGVEEVLFMPDYFGIVPRALESIRVRIDVRPVEMPIRGTQDDSTLAATLMAEVGVACIITLGGDGTNRVVAKGTVDIPLMPISTGTNNVFPVMVEGTIAGLAAGVIARRMVPLEEATLPTNRLDVIIDGRPVDLALVDVAVYDDPFVATRAIWDISKVREIFLARAAANNVGLSSIGGSLHCAQMDSQHGAYLRLAADESEGVELTAPVGPGLVKPVRVSAFRLLAVGDEERVHFQPSILALDGEREVETHRNREVVIRLSDRGPRVVDVGRALALAAQHQCFYVSPHPADGRCWLAQRGICRNPC